MRHLKSAEKAFVHLSSHDTAMLATQTNLKNAGVVSLRASGVTKILQTAVQKN